MSGSQQTAHRTDVHAGRTVADVMQTGVATAHLDAPVKEIAATMARNRVSTIPVISTTGQVAGVVTSSDLIRQLGRPGQRRGCPVVALEPSRPRPAQS